MHYVVLRGAAKGARLTPHQHKDDMFVASRTRFKSDYQRFATAEEAFAAAKANNWGIRMSAGCGSAASLIKASNVLR